MVQAVTDIPTVLLCLFIATQTCSTCHLTAVKNSTEPDSSSYLQQGLFNCFFFVLSTQMCLAFVEILPNSASLAPLE
jgi:hypothetical protein